MTQKGFTLQEVPNSDLADFLSIDNVQLAPEGTPVDQNDDFLTLIPEGDAGKQWLFAGFVDQYEQLGIIETAFSVIEELPVAPGRGFTDGTLRKVPNDSIFFYQPNPDRTSGVVTMNNDIVDALITTFDLRANQPFTFVIPTEGFTLNIDNDLTKNGAYIVRDDITFNPQECDDSNIVEGIFITNGIFTADPIHDRMQSRVHPRAKVLNAPLMREPSLPWRGFFIVVLLPKNGSLKVDGILVGQGVDEDFANARRSTLSARPIDETTPGLFDDSLPGQARELFNTCLLPNLLNYIEGDPAGNTGNPDYARPVSVKKLEIANGEIITVPNAGLSEPGAAGGICTIASFDRGRDRIEQQPQYADFTCDGSTGVQCTVHSQIIENITNPDAPDIPFEFDLTRRDFNNYAEWTVNTHVWDGIRNANSSNFAQVVDQLGIDNIPDAFIDKTTNEVDRFYCPPNNDIEGCFEITYYQITSGILDTTTIEVFKPARDVARTLTLEPYTDVRRGYATFDGVVDQFGIDQTGDLDVFNPQGGILAALQALGGQPLPWYLRYVSSASGLPLLFNGETFLNIYDSFIDYQRLITYQGATAQQNRERSDQIFEGSAVLLELNASKRTQLSPGLKRYLESTLVER